MDLNEYAKAYQEKYRHPPLIIGREYEYFGQWVRLVEASETGVNVTIANRSEDMTTCDKMELDWKPDREPKKPTT